jgi:hypothetical protein
LKVRRREPAVPGRAIARPKHWQIEEPPDPEPARQPALGRRFRQVGRKECKRKSQEPSHAARTSKQIFVDGLDHFTATVVRQWVRLTAVIVRTIGRRVGPDTSTRMAMDAHLTTSSEGPAFDHHPLRRQRLVEHNAVDACDGRCERLAPRLRRAGVRGA